MVVPSLIVIPAELADMCSFAVSPMVVIAPNFATLVLLSNTSNLFSLSITLSLLFVVFLIVIVPPSIIVFAPNSATTLLLSNISNLFSLNTTLSLLLVTF